MTDGREELIDGGERSEKVEVGEKGRAREGGKV